MKLVANFQHFRAKYRDFKPVLINLQRQLQTCLAKHKQLASKAIQEHWQKEGGAPRDQSVDVYELMAADLNYTERRLMTEKEDGSFVRNAKSLFNLFILHDPLINKIILTMQECIIRDTDPQSTKPGQLASCWYEQADLLAETIRDGGQGRNSKSAPGMLRDSEIIQQVIHEDIKRIVDDMRRFRVDFYDQVGLSGKCLVGAKTALSRRWVVFYQSMINLGILSLSEPSADGQGARP